MLTAIQRARLLFPIIATVSAVLLFATHAPAQDTYHLTDDDEWTPVEEPEPGTPEAELEMVRQQLAGENYARAQALATQWIERYGRRHHLLPEAYLLRGDALVGQREFYEALFDYEYLIRSFPGSEAFVIANQREYEIATLYASGVKRKFLGFRILSAEDEAEELLIRVQERLPGSQLAEKAGIDLGDFYFQRRRMKLAAEAYSLFVENYPYSQWVAKARRRLIYATLADYKGPEFDPAGLYEARTRLQQLQQIDPVAAERLNASGLLTRIDQQDALKMLTTALWYERSGDPISAEFMIRRLVEKYPDAVATADAMRIIPRILDKLPQNVIDEAPDYHTYREAILGIEGDE